MSATCRNAPILLRKKIRDKRHKRHMFRNCPSNNLVQVIIVYHNNYKKSSIVYINIYPNSTNATVVLLIVSFYFSKHLFKIGHKQIIRTSRVHTSLDTFVTTIIFAIIVNCFIKGNKIICCYSRRSFIYVIFC